MTKMLDVFVSKSILYFYIKILDEIKKIPPKYTKIYPPKNIIFASNGPL
jgi:hypothetical protein